MAWVKLVPAWGWWLLAVVLVGGLQQVRVWSAEAGESSARSELSDYRLQVAERDRRAEALARAEERRRQDAADQLRGEAHAQIEQAQADAAAADSAADGLRREADRLKRKLASCASTGAGSAPGRDAGTVLADVLSEVEAAGRAMAAEADRRGVAGAACERQYGRVAGGE